MENIVKYKYCQELLRSKTEMIHVHLQKNAESQFLLL